MATPGSAVGPVSSDPTAEVACGPTPSCSEPPQGTTTWVKDRIGTATGLFLIVSLLLVNASRFALWEDAYADGNINSASVHVVYNLASLIVALGVSFSLEGAEAAARIFAWASLWRFLVISLLFTVASHLIMGAFRLGTPALLVATIGYLYLPIAALLSVCAFPRRYGQLEWLALALLTLGTISFLLLRERAKWLATDDDDDEGRKPVQIGTRTLYAPEWVLHGSSGYFDVLQVEGTGLVLAAVCISAMASILAERIYKGRVPGLSDDAFYIMKVRIDLSSLVFSFCLWMAPSRVIRAVPLLYMSDYWFGPWTWRQGLMVLIAVLQGWLSGIVVKQFSTVCKSITQTLSTIVAVCICDPLLHKYDFRDRALPTFSLACIVVMSAMIFQTGRVNGRVLDERWSELVSSPQSPQRSFASFGSNTDSGDEENRRFSDGKWNLSCIFERVNTMIGLLTQMGCCLPMPELAQVRGYVLMFVYIMVFAAESLLKQFVLSRMPIVMGTLNLMTFTAGVVVASFRTIYSEGCEGLKRAWHPRQILKFLPCGVLFACSQAFVFMAFSLHVPASIVTILGFVYTPISALGKRCVLQKVTMWLQWVALLIVTLASMTFGFLQRFDTSNDSHPVPLLGLLCVIASATLSAFASLFMERFLKDEADPFFIQKVALDLGSLFTSIFLLFLSGWMSERPQDAFWRDRPMGSCTDNDCWGHVGSDSTCASSACSCSCDSGLFVGWGSPWVTLLLLVVMGKGWFKGEVTKQTSTLEVAIAESFGPLLIYFVGEPIVFGSSLRDWALNAVVFIAPLSAVVFNIADVELQRVFAGMRAAGLRSAVREEGNHVCPLEAFLENLKEVEEEGISDDGGESLESGEEDARRYFSASRNFGLCNCGKEDDDGEEQGSSSD